MVKDIEGYHIFALGAQNPDKTPRMSTHCPPITPPRHRGGPQDVGDVSMAARIGVRQSINRSLVP